ncbi:MAG: glutamine synthetase [Clostridia bacterium]|nr:glutamine synthetase [Clostridia bacterium]
MSELLYFIDPKKETYDSIKEKLIQHPQIKFVSLVAVDLGNNSTDERIPVNLFLEDVAGMLENGVQTDGSSVNLPEIAEINNAKVDIIPDKTVKWLVDYNYTYHTDRGENKPVGTLCIPSFLVHDEQMVCSRSILKNAITHFSSTVKDLLGKYPATLKQVGLESVDEIEEVVLTTATELEFWVKTPDNRTSEEKLTTSQVLKEQYWKRTVGPVRSAMEQALIELDKFDYGAEMGHKEVGGVPSKVIGMSQYTHIMEQLEIDWKFSNAMQSADHEMFAKDIIKDTFVRLGLDVTFLAKPVEGVAGNGEHHHLGVALKLKNGKMKNLFAPQDMKSAFLNIFGWGALMGILKNYEVINPFVTSTNDAFNRLKPGFEAPICTVASLGHTPEVPSRNRTVLIGLVRDINAPLATRFELRAPNPNSNTYLTTAACYQGMLDGITYAVTNNKSIEELEKEMNKKSGETADYLETSREYRSEEDVFEDYTEEERNALFAQPPSTVWENVQSFEAYPEKVEVLTSGNVFTNKLLSSYKASIMAQWTTELNGRIIPNNMGIIRKYSKLHSVDDITDLDVVNWEKCNALRHFLMKDSLANKSLFTKIRESIASCDYDLVSQTQIEMMKNMTELKNLYATYKQNLL